MVEAKVGLWFGEEGFGCGGKKPLHLAFGARVSEGESEE